MKNIVNKDKIVDKAQSLLLHDDRAIDAYLYIGTGKYEIHSFETEFSQEIDYKGQPQHEVKGGLLAFTLTQPADSLLNRWMFQREVFYDGTIVFAPISRVSSSPLRIAFFRARCISFQKMAGATLGIQLRLLISPGKVNLNDIDHQNAPYISQSEE
jgi:hypothetical protein